MLGKPAECIDFHQEVFNAYPREVAPHQLALRRGPLGFTLARVSAQPQTPALNAGKRIGRPGVLGLCCGVMKLLDEGLDGSCPISCQTQGIAGRLPHLVWSKNSNPA